MLKILLVDDNEDSRFLVPAFLKNEPFVVETAENGKVALERLEAGGFDLVLMDMQMPVMDGLEATREIRERERASGRASQRLTVIAMTASEQDDDRSRMIKAGCDGYLCKPFRKVELLTLLEKCKPGATK